MAYAAVSVLSAALAAFLMLSTYETAHGLDPTAATNLISLYTELHKFVLPVPDRGSFGDDTDVMKRFILRSPGRVMYPEEYTDNLDEKLFYLSDEVPGMNPLSGAVTEKSFVKQYQEALENIRVRDLGDITGNKRAMYNKASEVLKQPRTSPMNDSLSVSLLEVYNHYEKLYYEELEKAASPNYETDAAYKNWVVLGEKALVEYHMKYMNVLPSGEDLQAALDELDTEMIALEDSDTAIYPIAFTPATWTSYIDDAYSEGVTGDWALTEKEHKDGWAEFSFDSTGQLASIQPVAYSTAYEYGVLGGLWDGSGNILYSSRDSSLTRLLNTVNSVSVRTKILPVTMDRKWFHPSLFGSADLTIASAIAAVSPGFLSEREFFAASTSQAPTYSFPSYQSTLIFAKDVVLEFTGMSAADSEAALQLCSDPYVSARYGPFTVFGALDSQSSMQASAISSGVQIVVPGMQLIGYVTDIVPKFPWL